MLPSENPSQNTSSTIHITTVHFNEHPIESSLTDSTSILSLSSDQSSVPVHEETRVPVVTEEQEPLPIPNVNESPLDKDHDLTPPSSDNHASPPGTQTLDKIADMIIEVLPQSFGEWLDSQGPIISMICLAVSFIAVFIPMCYSCCRAHRKVSFN